MIQVSWEYIKKGVTKKAQRLDIALVIGQIVHKSSLGIRA